MKVLRPYQKDAVDAILHSWSSNRTTLAVMATGAGKTLVTAGVTKRLNGKGKVLFLANRNELVTQPLATFAQELGYVPDLEKAEKRASLSSSVVIGSVQTLARQQRLKRFPQDHFSFIFADEAHLSLAPSWQRIFDHFIGAKICGVTATPFRSDAKLLRDIYQSEACRVNLFDLVDQGYLVNPDNVYKLESAISLANVRLKKTTEGVDYDLDEAADAIAPFFVEIAKELKREHANRHILAFLPLIATSRKFVEACAAQGINAVHVDGEDPDRDTKLQAFRDGRIGLLSNANLLGVGVDIPICDATLCLRPTRSKTLYQQIIGRSTRPLPGVIDASESVSERLDRIASSRKPNALIIDPLWVSHEMDLCTPSFLIAESEKEAIELEQRAGKEKRYSLQALKDSIQREREEAIARRLANAARFREGRLDYRYLAAQTGEHKLLTYEPVFHKECRPPTRFTLELIKAAGIDPSNVTSQGLADEIRKAIGRRRYQELAEISQLAPIAESKGVTPDIWTIKKYDKSLASIT